MAKVSDPKKKKPHDCAWKKWIEQTYVPWYNSRTEAEGDEGGNPSGPPPPPPPNFEDDGD